MLLTNILIILVVVLTITLIITLSYLKKIQNDPPTLLKNVQKLLDTISVDDVESIQLVAMYIKFLIPIHSLPLYTIDKTMIGRKVYDIVRGTGTIKSVTKGVYCVGVAFNNDPDSVIMFSRQGKLFEEDRIRLVIHPKVIYRLQQLENFFITH